MLCTVTRRTCAAWCRSAAEFQRSCPACPCVRCPNPLCGPYCFNGTTCCRIMARPFGSLTICASPSGAIAYKPGKPAPSSRGPICRPPRCPLSRSTRPAYHRRNMSTSPQSKLVDSLDQGVILHVRIEDLHFTAYVVVSEPDVNRVADFVTPEQFEQDGDVHVTAVTHPDEAREQI